MGFSRCGSGLKLLHDRRAVLTVVRQTHAVDLTRAQGAICCLDLTAAVVAQAEQSLSVTPVASATLPDSTQLS